MSNSTELSTSNQFTSVLASELDRVRDALPIGFNSIQYTLNAKDFVNGKDDLIKFARQHGAAQIIACFVKGAYLGLDAMNGECYMIPYGSTLQFMSSYRGMAKMAKKYSQRRIRDIYAKVVREGDEYEEGVDNGEPYVKFHPKNFNDAPIEGAFAVCIFEDGGKLTESMSVKAIEACRKQSKAQNSPAWSKFWEEMAKKTVIRRLCKNITIDMNSQAREAFEAGTEIETDAAKIAEKEIAESENSLPFDIEDVEEVIE